MGRYYASQHMPVENAAVDISKIFSPSSGMSQSRIVYLSGDVTEDSINIVQQQLLELANISILPIHLVVSTVGGEVSEMFSVCDVMRFIPAPVYTCAIGKAMSAGSLILASGVKGNRMISKSARVMIHALAGGVMGNIFEVLNETSEMKYLHDMYIEQMIANTKMSKEQLTKMLECKTNTYLGAQDVVRLGIADKII